MGKVIEMFPGASKMQAPEVEKTRENIQLNFKRYVDLLFKISKILKTIPGNINGKVYQDYMLMIKDWENEALIIEINNPDELKLKTTPLFYRAVINTAMSRGLAPSNKEK